MRPPIRAAAATLAIVGRAHLPRLLQPRGWVLAGLALLPALLGGLSAVLPHARPSASLGVFLHQGVLAMGVVPILALVAGPAGVPEDLEQRTLPLLLVRPVPAWSLPLARALPWFAWGALWILASCLGLWGLGLLEDPVAGSAAVLAQWWAQLAFVTLMVLAFRRGAVWSALVLLVWDPLVQFLPGSLQRATFLHHVQVISGTRASTVGARSLLAQAPVYTPVWVALLALLGAGALAWALVGRRLHRRPVGLAGPEGEG